MTTTADADFEFAAFSSVPYDQEWSITKNGAALDLTGWTGLSLVLKTAGGTHTITLSQVATAVQGVRPLTPLTAGKVRVRIDAATLQAVPASRPTPILTGSLKGTNPEGLAERLEGVRCLLTLDH